MPPRTTTTDPPATGYFGALPGTGHVVPAPVTRAVPRAPDEPAHRKVTMADPARVARLAVAVGPDAARYAGRLLTALGGHEQPAADGPAAGPTPADAGDERAPRPPADPGCVVVLGDGVVAARGGWAWSHQPLPRFVDDLAHARLSHDAATIVARPDGGIEVRCGVSGAQGVYVHLAAPGGTSAVTSDPAAFALAGLERARPDWDAWAQIIAGGGALAGGTPFGGVRRLQPGESLVVSGAGVARLEPRRWEWLEDTEASSGRLDRVADALDAAVGRIAAHSVPQPLLSGGWDSRVLTTLAARHHPEVTVWTTSKDTGTAREELVARQVARALAVQHRLVPARADRYPEDLAAYADAVAHQTSYHVWLEPLARALGDVPGTAVDGLGGGVFFGGAFPPTHGFGAPADRRFAQLVRYLRDAPGVLRPAVEAQLAARTRAAFDRVTTPLEGHREVDALSAYLTRTLPGISLGPYGLLATHIRAATPFLDHDVVRTSTAMPVRARRDRRLYPVLLRRWAPAMAELPTAVEPPPQWRLRPRRSASRHTASVCRQVLRRHAVGTLLHPRLLSADIATWQGHLESNADQHVLRSLWVLVLWLERHRLPAPGIDTLREPVG